MTMQYLLSVCLNLFVDPLHTECEDRGIEFI